MQQLIALDNMFVLQETQRIPMHIGPVIIYDQSEVESRTEDPRRGQKILSENDGSGDRLSSHV